MKSRHHAATWQLLLVLLIGCRASSNAVVSSPSLRRSQPSNHLAGLSRSPGRSLLSHTPPPPQQRSTHFVAVPEGKLPLVDSNSGEVIYSVHLDAPLYSSYQAAGVRDDERFFYVDVDEDGTPPLDTSWQKRKSRKIYS